MHRRIGSFLIRLATGSIALLAGCNQTQAPTLCVFTAGELDGGKPEDLACPEPDAVDPDMDEALTRCGAVGTGEAYFVLHELPADITPPGPVEIRIQTPCGESKLEAPYVRGVALVSLVAPQGASCSFAVTTVVANSELRCTSAIAAEGACADLAAVCAPTEAGGMSGDL